VGLPVGRNPCASGRGRFFVASTARIAAARLDRRKRCSIIRYCKSVWLGLVDEAPSRSTFVPSSY
jgi:hypothetical protein